MALLEVAGLESGYGHLRVLWGLSLIVEEGSATCILGPNGAGKTTLAKTIMGELPTKAGEVRFEGSALSARAEDRAKLGIIHVPQGRRLFTDMTVAENLKVGSIAAGRRHSASTIDWVRDLFPILDERKRQVAGTLSGGEQQMLALGRALMAEPRLLILDEPSLGLAPKVVRTVYRAIDRIRERGISLLLIDQVVARALEISDVVSVVVNGRVRESGAAVRFEDPETLRRAYLGFSGSSEGQKVEQDE